MIDSLTLESLVLFVPWALGLFFCQKLSYNKFESRQCTAAYGLQSPKSLAWWRQSLDGYGFRERARQN